MSWNQIAINTLLSTLLTVDCRTALAATNVRDTLERAQELFEVGRYCEAMVEFNHHKQEIEQVFADDPTYGDRWVDSMSRCGAIGEATDTLEMLMPKIDTISEDRRDRWRRWFTQKRRLLENLKLAVRAPNVAPGERFLLNGQDITDQILRNAASFVERGTYCLTATAPGRVPWTQCGKTTEGNALVVPPLGPLPTTDTKVAAASELAYTRPFRWELVIPLAMGVVASTAGLAWYLGQRGHAKDAYEAYQEALSSGNRDRVSNARFEVEAARSQRDTAQTVTLISAGVTAGVLIAAGSLWWFDGQRGRKHRTNQGAYVFPPPHVLLGMGPDRAVGAGALVRF